MLDIRGDELTIPFAVPEPAPDESVDTSLQRLRYDEASAAQHLLVRGPVSRDPISVVPAIVPIELY